METKKTLRAAGRAELEVFSDAILALEKKRKSHIFCFIEGASEHICHPAVWNVLRRRKEFAKVKTLEIVLHSGGGHANIAYKIAKFFREHCETLNVIVPFEAKSAATLMCLAADEIYLSKFAELGPLDVQVQDQLERGARPFSPLDESKTLEFLRDYAVESLDYFTAFLLDRSGMSIKEALHESIPCVTAMMRPMYEKIDPLKFGEHRRLLSEGEEYAKRLLQLAGHQNYEEIASKLVENYPVHDFVIDFSEAGDKLDLPVKELDSLDFDLLQTLWPMTGQGFYGFIKPKRMSRNRNATKPRTERQKRLAVVQNTNNKATA